MAVRDFFGTDGHCFSFRPTAAATPRFHTMDQVAGNVYRMCKDQHGCRFLQKKLEEAHPKAVEMIFSEVYDHMVELMTDPFGNYLCQKLIEHCDHPQVLSCFAI